jgi:hypothetical protein
MNMDIDGYKDRDRNMDMEMNMKIIASFLQKIRFIGSKLRILMYDHYVPKK